MAIAGIDDHSGGFGVVRRVEIHERADAVVLRFVHETLLCHRRRIEGGQHWPHFRGVVTPLRHALILRRRRSQEAVKATDRTETRTRGEWEFFWGLGE
jgi:hypothetical protein